jgi:hypothetical protein
MTYDYSTAWRFVGKHLHWNPRVEELAHEYVRRAFGLSAVDAIPPVRPPSLILVPISDVDFPL